MTTQAKNSNALATFMRRGRASFILGGQFGSEGKGAAAAWLACHLAKQGQTIDVITTNAGAQAGHTAIVDGKTYVTNHLPTAALFCKSTSTYLNAGAIIDLGVLGHELSKYGEQLAARSVLVIHPNAAVITDDDKAAEMRSDSVQTTIASTRKGVGQALSRKVLRSGLIARQYEREIFSCMAATVKVLNLNFLLRLGSCVLVEVPQGISLGVNQRFYPHCTSRNCTVAQAAADADIHPKFVDNVMLVMRTFPIRVGNIEGEPSYSGVCYPDQKEISWEALGVKPEITTVTGRIRRVFTWSHQQMVEAMMLSRPSIILLTHVDYAGISRLKEYVFSIHGAAAAAGMDPPVIAYSTGPSVEDVKFYEG